MKKVILVEDDAAIRDTLSIFFEASHFTLETFHDGEKILSSNYDIPDVFLLDKQLSGVDGLDLCRHIKSQLHTRDIPVIMMSASPSIISLAAAAGADDVIVKPFKLADVRNVIMKFL